MKQNKNLINMIITGVIIMSFFGLYFYFTNKFKGLTFNNLPIINNSVNQVKNNKIDLKSVLSLEILKNAKYRLSDSSSEVQFVDGSYNNNNSEDPEIDKLIEEQIVYNESENQVALVIVTNAGMPNSWSTIVIMGVAGGKPEQIAVYSLSENLVEIKKIVFSEKIVKAQALVHGLKDFEGKPTLEKVLVFELDINNKLNYVGFEEMKDWKIYVNEFNHFSFMYPKELSFNNINELRYTLNDPQNDFKWAIDLNISYNDKNLTLDEATKELIQGFKDSGTDVATSEIILGGFSAKKIILKDYKEYGNVRAVVLKNDKIYVFSGDDSSTVLGIQLEDMLLSFRFTQ